MKPERVILNLLTNARTRVHRQVLLQKVTSALFWGLVLLAMLFVVNRLIPLPMRLMDMSLFIIFGAMGVGLCLSFRHREDLRTVARTFDRGMGLKERFSTAYELIDAVAGDRKPSPYGEAGAPGVDASPFARLQIRDAANAVSDKSEHLGAIFPYRMPRLLKAVPIPLLCIGLSFAVPRLYDVPPPLTAAQQKAIDTAVQRLEKMQGDNPSLHAQLHDAVSQLKAVKDVHDVHTVQAALSALNAEVRNQKVARADEIEAAIAEAVQAAPRFKGMDAGQLSAELEALAAQQELSPELQAELLELFARLAESVPRGSLSDALSHIQGEPVSQETLQDIADALRQAKAFAQLERLEAQLTASRKALALASVDTQNLSGGVANSDSAPGQEAGSSEVQGTLEMGNDESQARVASKGSAGDKPARYGEDAAPLTGDETASLQVSGTQLTLTPAPSSESQRFSRVFTGAAALSGESSYRIFDDVVLSAKREYAQAIENNRIPMRYQSQIKTYLDAIATENKRYVTRRGTSPRTTEKEE